MGYTYSLGGTPLLDSLMFEGFVGILAPEFLRKQRGDARLASSFTTSWLGEQCPRKAVGLLGPGPHVVRRCHGTNPPMKRRVAQRGQWPRSSDFASFCCCFLLVISCQISTIVHSVVLPTIFEKYIHTKIEVNLLKSVAYKTPDIHVPLFNPLLHALFYCKASN